VLLERGHQADTPGVTLAAARAEHAGTPVAAGQEAEPGMCSIRMQTELTERVEQVLVAGAERRRLDQRCLGVEVERVRGPGDTEQRLRFAIERREVGVRDGPGVGEARIAALGVILARPKVPRVQPLELCGVEPRRSARAAAERSEELHRPEAGVALDREWPVPAGEPSLGTFVGIVRDPAVPAIGISEQERAPLEEQDAPAAPGEGVARSRPTHARADDDRVPGVVEPLGCVGCHAWVDRRHAGGLSAPARARRSTEMPATGTVSTR